MICYGVILKLLLMGVVAYIVSCIGCRIIIRMNKKKEYQGYRDNKFWCTKCGRELTMAQTFYEVCPYCNDSYS
jgi:Zn finger protein HypA/HybF involved in hydrogenase expression